MDWSRLEARAAVTRVPAKRPAAVLAVPSEILSRSATSTWVRPPKNALLFHSLMVLTGSYRRYERIALVLSVALFTFVVLAFTVHLDTGAAIGGLSVAQSLGSRPYLDLVVATVGAVVMPWMLFYRQAATVDKGLGIEDLPAARVETLVGAVATASANAYLNCGTYTLVGGGTLAPAS